MKTGDVIGHEFGNWLAIGPCSDGIRIWCQCKCGTIRPVISHNLVTGRSHSCGCEKRKKKTETKTTITMKDVLIDMSKSNAKYADCECCKHIPDSDMLGITFGDLTVVSSTDRPMYLHCKCSCGKEVDVAKYNLLYGHKVSCGCKPDENPSRRTKHEKPQKGDKYGRLTVIDFIAATKEKQAECRCMCSCGKEVVTRFSNLYSGTTQSCGCLKNVSGTKNIWYSSSEQKWIAVFWNKEAKRQIRVASGNNRSVVEQKYNNFLLTRGLSA